MKIVLDQSGYGLMNLGDLAMLQVAIARLKSFWPDADIHVFTTNAKRLSTHCPGTEAILPNGRKLWLSPLFDYHSKISNRNVAEVCLQLDSKLRDYAPSVFKLLFRKKLKRYSSEYADSFKVFIDAIHNADLVVASGGGYFNDSFIDHAASVLDTVGFASKLGKPTALLGQGFGPLHDPQLIEKHKQVLPNIDLIGVREKRSSVPLLKGVGVNQSQIHVTGDDAIELAYTARLKELGNSIGVNLRVANYSCVNESAIQVLRHTLYEAADLLGASFLPAPICLSSHSAEISDNVAIKNLLKDYSGDLGSGEAIDTPLKTIQQIGQCRLVITGSYHAGVFALSQGIPVIGLAMSEYYKEKFFGLADQFGIGCEVVCLDDHQFEDKLLNSIKSLWAEAELLRPKLLESAQLQIQSGQVAYKKLYDLVSSYRSRK
jgi:colanic acid/amylovoran biosynthesis protein